MTDNPTIIFVVLLSVALGVGIGLAQGRRLLTRRTLAFFAVLLALLALAIYEQVTGP